MVREGLLFGSTLSQALCVECLNFIPGHTSQTCLTHLTPQILLTCDGDSRTGSVFFPLASVTMAGRSESEFQGQEQRRFESGRRDVIEVAGEPSVHVPRRTARCSRVETSR